jgi:hypothetical protein
MAQLPANAAAEAADGGRVVWFIRGLSGLDYKRTRKDAETLLPVYRLGRVIRFDPDRITAYLSTRERYCTDATLKPFDGIARVNGKASGYCSLAISGRQCPLA